MARMLRVILAATLAAVFVFVFASLTTQRLVTLGNLATYQETHGCAALEDARIVLNLPREIEYAKRVIRNKKGNAADGEAPVSLTQRLIPAFETVNLDNGQCRLRDSSMTNGGERIVVPVSKPDVSNVDLSTLLFGMPTSLRLFEKAIPQLARWLAKTKVSLIVIVEDRDPEMMKTVQLMSDESGLDAVLFQDDHDYTAESATVARALRHFSLVEKLHLRRESHHQWFAVIEDDTFFPSLPALVKSLRAFDPTKPWYIGSLTEDWSILAQKYGYSAFSGAGIFLSAPLLDLLHDNYEACAEAANSNSTELYSRCTYTQTSPPVRLTQLTGLHQLDLQGDASGWYESGQRPVLSLHHYNSWHLFPVEYGHLVTDICGSDCFLQRFAFDDNVVLTNGYSIVHYPAGTADLDLSRVEATFQQEPDHFAFSLGVLRSKLPAEKKISWRLEYALRTSSGSVRQFYVRREGHDLTDAERLKARVKSVLELEWVR